MSKWRCGPLLPSSVDALLSVFEAAMLRAPTLDDAERIFNGLKVRAAAAKGRSGPWRWWWAGRGVPCHAVHRAPTAYYAPGPEGACRRGGAE